MRVEAARPDSGEDLRLIAISTPGGLNVILKLEGESLKAVREAVSTVVIAHELVR